MTTKSQIEPSTKIFDMVKDVKPPITPETLKDLQGVLFSKLEIRPYNKETKEHEQLIRWKRTASQILNDGYIYEGKACTDIVVLFLAMCKALGLETRFVKVRKDRAVHSIAEIKLNNEWYIFDVSVKNSNPEKGEVTEKSPFQEKWTLWKKGRDAWDLELVNFNSIKKIKVAK
jgi:hypothetical protein